MKKDLQQRSTKYGLLGRNISYSFSQNYFQKKFEREGITASYQNFDIPSIDDLNEVLEDNPGLRGLNVTIPYKEQVVPFLSALDPVAAEIGAVNTIRISPDGSLKGFNTDHYGFSEAIKPYLRSHHKKALILGTGGASKAINYALKQLDITPVFVSRTPKEGQLTYSELSPSILEDFSILINCTPLGTFPEVEALPPVPMDLIGEKHLIFDLIYNPPMTTFMARAAAKKATVVNGLKMLELQAEKSWEHWTAPS